MTSDEAPLRQQEMAGQEVSMVRARTSCVLAQAAALPLWSQDYTQLSTGHFRGEVDSIATRGIQLFRESMNRAVDELAIAPEGAYVIGIPNIVDGDAHWGMIPIESNSLITLNKNTELVFRTSHNSEISAAVVQADRIEEYAELVMEIDVRALFRSIKPVEKLPAAQATFLYETFHGFFRQVPPRELNQCTSPAWNYFEDDILSACVRVLSAASRDSGRTSDHRIHRYIVNRVRDRTLASPLCPPSIGELCTELKISRRTLNHAFIRVLGITPVAYIRNIRLNRVRAALLHEDPASASISSLGLRWGFWHMSLFARYYKELFGELPSETRETVASNDKKPMSC